MGGVGRMELLSSLPKAMLQKGRVGGSRELGTVGGALDWLSCSVCIVLSSLLPDILVTDSNALHWGAR